jgi:hypothetical protein
LSVGASEEEFIGDQPVQCSDVGAELRGAELFLECDDVGVCITDEGARQIDRCGFGHGNEEYGIDELDKDVPAFDGHVAPGSPSQSRNRK